MTPQQVYTRFIQNLLNNQTVYTLRKHFDNDWEYAECASEYRINDSDGLPESVLCFWDTEADARACQSAEWQDHRLHRLDLDEFLAELIEFQEQSSLIGVAFDEELIGSEVEPMELIGDLLTLAQHLQVDLPDADELLQQVIDWEKATLGNVQLH